MRLDSILVGMWFIEHSAVGEKFGYLAKGRVCFLSEKIPVKVIVDNFLTASLGSSGLRNNYFVLSVF